VIRPARQLPPRRRREHQQLSNTGASPPTVQPRLPAETTPVIHRFQFYIRVPGGDFVPLQSRIRGSIERHEDVSATVTLEDEDAISELPVELFLHDREHPGVYHRRSFRHAGYEKPLHVHTESESYSQESDEPDEDEIAG
jgi:hypothetical protein